jgi:FMN phosphatase YigB (HAD superfamily)
MKLIVTVHHAFRDGFRAAETAADVYNKTSLLSFMTSRSGTKNKASGSRSKKNSSPDKRVAASPVIRCVIFDLDDTLYDCFGQRVKPAHRHAAHAMVRAGLHATVEGAYRARMKAFNDDPMLRHIDAVVTEHFGGDPETISEAARNAYFNCPVGKLTLFAGTMPLLRFLHDRGINCFVVSFGEPKIQNAKVRSLGLDRTPTIDHIFYADRQNLLTKEGAFRQIQERLGLKPSEMLVVGDRAMSEIRAGNELGMHTVRIRRGEFARQDSKGKIEQPDYTVKSISEVRKLPYVWGDGRKGPQEN